MAIRSAAEPTKTVEQCLLWSLAQYEVLISNQLKRGEQIGESGTFCLFCSTFFACRQY